MTCYFFFDCSCPFSERFLLRGRADDNLLNQTEQVELWFTCLTVPSSKPVATDAFITSKRILTSNSVINAWVVEALVNICKTKKKNKRKKISLSATFLLIDFILTHILRSCLYNGISLFSVASLLLLIITLIFSTSFIHFGRAPPRIRMSVPAVWDGHNPNKGKFCF